MGDRREDATTMINAVLRPGGVPIEIQSKRDTAAFRRYTGVDHQDLVAQWKAKLPKTACNGFVSWYAGRMHITDGIPKENWFELENWLRENGKGHAWVAAVNDQRKPQPGDILHHRQNGTGLHVDVAMGFTPQGYLIRAAAGQTLFVAGRRPEDQTDVLKIVTGTGKYNFRNLIGWLDLEQFFAEAPSGGETGPTLNWAPGWWDVNDGQQYYYYFDSNRNVQYTKARPALLYSPPAKPLNTGRYSFPQHHMIRIEWNRLDGEPTVETFTADDHRVSMQGTSNLYGPLAAKRLHYPRK